MAGFLMFLCALAALLTNTESLDTPQGFPTVSSLRVRSGRINTAPSQLPQFVTYPQRSAAYPTIRFTCSGTISRIWFIGKVSSTSGTTATSPVFQIWRPPLSDSDGNTANANYELVSNLTAEESQVVVDGSEYAVFEIDIESDSTAARFQEGYILGSVTAQQTNVISIAGTTNAVITPAYLPSVTDTVQLKSTTEFVSELSFFRVGTTVNSSPLLAIESDNPDCVQGGLQLSVLNSLLTRVGSFPGELRIIPELTLNCAALITNIFIGAAYFQPTVSTESDNNPRIVIWNCTNSCERLYSTTITRQALTQAASFPTCLYKTDINFRLILTEARENFTIGIEQPSSTGVQVYFQQDGGLTNYQRAFSKDILTTIDFDDTSFTSSQALPLIHPVLESVEGNDNCDDSFIDLDTLQERSLLIQPIFTPTVSTGSRQSRQGNTGYQYFFLHSPFQSSGVLSDIIFAAEQTQIQGVLNPIFQIWRCDGNGVFKKMFSTNGSAPLPFPSALNMYQYSMQFQYQTGDVLGLYQPMLERSQLIVAYQMLDNVTTTPTFPNFRVQSQLDSFETYNYLNSMEEQEYLNYTPLLTVATTQDEIANSDVLQSCIGESPPTVLLPSTETESTANTELSSSSTIMTETNFESSLSVVAIAGSAVGAVIGVLVLMVLAVVLFLLALKCKRRKEKKFEMPDSLSPGHSSAEANGNQFESSARYERVYATLTRDQPPPLPKSPPPTYQAVGDPAQPYEVPSISRTTISQSSAQEYEVPSITSAGVKRVNGQGSQGYHTLEPTMLQNVSNVDNLRGDEHIEMAVIVPTEDQRERMTGDNESDLYASLKVNRTATVDFFEEAEVYWLPASSPTQIYEQLASRKYREIPRHHIQIGDQIGSGNFGEVHKGAWSKDKAPEMVVAIKKLKDRASNEDKVKFLQEAAIMGQFRHPNVIKLMGVVTVGEPVMIVTELMENGDLLSYLRNNFAGHKVGSDGPELLLTFCQQVSAGMDYLAKKGFVHRDLATRNILVSADKICKVTDFGMSREISEYYVAKGGVVPVKWTAPEALTYKKFSTASDVWSFGCVMYEIWSLGHKPFEKTNNYEVLKLIEGGYRLPPPPGCPRELYRLMIQCWHPDPGARPLFTELLMSLLTPVEQLLVTGGPEEVNNNNPKATQLGNALKHSKNLYTDLQNAYKKTEAD